MWSKYIRGGVSIGVVLLPIVVFAIQTALSREEAEKKGIVTYVEGSAKKQKVSEVDWYSVIKDAPVVSGERVRTFAESRAELEIAQLDRVRMAPRTTIDILKLYDESVEQRRESAIELQSGELWAHIGKKSDKQTFSIITPVAAAAITGTTLRLRVDPDSSAELKVYSGEVVLSKAAGPASGRAHGLNEPYRVPGPTEVAAPHEVSLEAWSLIVKSMQRVRVNGRGQVVQNGSFSNADPEEQDDWVKWNKQRDEAQR